MREAVAGIADRLDHAGAELGAQAADVDIDDVGPRVEGAAPDLFEELGAQSDAFKKLEPQINTAETKLGDASKKLQEAAALKLPDWYKQYLTNLSDLNKSGSTSANLILQTVKNTYDPSIKSPEDLDAKQKALMEKLDAETKRRTDLAAALDKIKAEHKDEFKSA